MPDIEETIPVETGDGYKYICADCGTWIILPPSPLPPRIAWVHDESDGGHHRFILLSESPYKLAPPIAI